MTNSNIATDILQRRLCNDFLFILLCTEDKKLHFSTYKPKPKTTPEQHQNNTKMFHFRDELLHFDEICLFVSRPMMCDARSQRRAWGRLVAEALDSQNSMDGTQSFPRSKAFGRLIDAIATLTASHARVEVLDDRSPNIPGIVLKDDEGTTSVEIRVMGDWNLRCLAEPKKSSSTEAWEIIISTSPSPCFAFRIPCPTYPDHLVPPSTVAWNWVFRTRKHALRIGTVDDEPSCANNAKFTVHLFCCGIIWFTEAFPSEHPRLRHTSFYVDMITSDVPQGDDDLGWLPVFPDIIDDAGATNFGSIFMRTCCMKELSSSLVVQSLCRCARPWRSVLSEKWIFRGDRTQQLVDLLRQEELPDDVLRLVDGRVLLHQIGRDDRIDLTGTIFLRRLQATSCARSADYKVSIMNDFSVGEFAVIPVGCLRFVHLFDIGILDRLDNVSRYGVLWGDGSDRTVALPNDSTSRHIVMALTTLLHYDIQIDEITDPASDGLYFQGNKLLTEPGCAGHTANEPLCAYFVRIDPKEKSVFLARDPHTISSNATDVIPIDNIFSLHLSHVSTRTRRSDVMNTFPMLARRIELQNNTLEACIREVQARRVSSEWSLEALDCGGNLSSMGMAVMTAILLTGWIGIRVRVFVGRCRSALVGVWDDTTANFQLVDPSWTVKNTFDICSHFSTLSESGHDLFVRKGMILEVRRGDKWHVAKIISVQSQLMSASIRFIANGQDGNISLSSHCWRRLSDDDSDVDRLLRGVARRNHTKSLEEPAHKKRRMASE